MSNAAATDPVGGRAERGERVRGRLWPFWLGTALLAALLLWVVHLQRRAREAALACEAQGGVYVQTYRGYRCLAWPGGADPQRQGAALRPESESATRERHRRG